MLTRKQSVLLGFEKGEAVRQVKPLPLVGRGLGRGIKPARTQKGGSPTLPPQNRMVDE